MDERYAVVDIIGKGLIVFSAYVYPNILPLELRDVLLGVPMLESLTLSKTL
jgi:hypothetical protein